MKITKERLKEIIKEELEEASRFRAPSRAAGDRSGGMRASNAKLYDYLKTKLGEPLAVELIAAVEELDIDTQVYIMNLVDDMVIREE
tara:strand:+ start:40 stop:300 length:261 start_codon:yes stop_codon:yes gene_type:complete